MSTQTSQKRLIIRWATLKGVIALILFLVITILAEYVVVLYAINLGLKDESLLRWSFGFSGTTWDFTVTVSPLFHLVPLTVTISLVSSWICLTRYATVKPIETPKRKTETTAKRGQKQRLKGLRKFGGRVKSGFLKVKGIAYIWQKIHFARATVKSALMVLLVFLVFVVVTSLLIYPELIYQTISGAYKTNPSLFNFITGTRQFFASIGGIFSAIESALRASAPGFRDFVVVLGSVTKPLADLDNAGKYLVSQNAAAWLSALTTLLYGEFRRKGFRYKKVRRS